MGSPLAGNRESRHRMQTFSVPEPAVGTDLVSNLVGTVDELSFPSRESASVRRTGVVSILREGPVST